MNGEEIIKKMLSSGKCNTWTRASPLGNESIIAVYIKLIKTSVTFTFMPCCTVGMTFIVNVCNQRGVEKGGKTYIIWDVRHVIPKLSRNKFYPFAF